MTRLTSKIEWHDLRWDPDDLPSPNEEVIITVESLNGEDRKVLGKASWLYDHNGNPGWTCLDKDIGNYPIWEPVIAWAYYPDPYPVE